MQVQCDDVTYFVTAQALGVTNQVVCYSRSLDQVIGALPGGPDIRLDMNSAHQLLGLAWRGAPQQVTSTTAMEANMTNRVVVLWLSPLCKCASHRPTHFAAPPYAYGVSVAAKGIDAGEVCYIKVWAKPAYAV